MVCRSTIEINLVESYSEENISSPVDYNCRLGLNVLAGRSGPRLSAPLARRSRVSVAVTRERPSGLDYVDPSGSRPPPKMRGPLRPLSAPLDLQLIWKSQSSCMHPGRSSGSCFATPLDRRRGACYAAVIFRAALARAAFSRRPSECSDQSKSALDDWILSNFYLAWQCFSALFLDVRLDLRNPFSGFLLYKINAASAVNFRLSVAFLILKIFFKTSNLMQVWSFRKATLSLKFVKNNSRLWQWV